MTVLELREEEKRAREMASALDWLRSNDAADGVDDMSLVSGLGSVASFLKFDQMSRASGGGAADALEWLRSQASGDKASGADSVGVASASVGVRPLTEEEQRVKDMGTALDWLRQNDVGSVGDMFGGRR